MRMIRDGEDREQPWLIPFVLASLMAHAVVIAIIHWMPMP